jgi:hypothetical protein
MEQIRLQTTIRKHQYTHNTTEASQDEWRHTKPTLRNHATNTITQRSFEWANQNEITNTISIHTSNTFYIKIRSKTTRSTNPELRWHEEWGNRERWGTNQTKRKKKKWNKTRCTRLARRSSRNEVL